MQTSAPHRWQLARELRSVLFWWWSSSTALSGLKVLVLKKMLWLFTISVRTTRRKSFWQAKVLETSIRKRSTRFIMFPIKCFDLSLQVHTRKGESQALSGSNFFPLMEKTSYILLPVSQSKPRAEQEPFAPNWFASSGLALVWSTPVLASVKGCWRGLLMNLHVPTPFAQISQGCFRLDLCCYTSGNHGSILANFCSPSKTTKLVQISIELLERASKKCSYWKNQLFTWTLTNFKFK